jgi:hypothetical protein
MMRPTCPLQPPSYLANCAIVCGMVGPGLCIICDEEEFLLLLYTLGSQSSWPFIRSRSRALAAARPCCIPAHGAAGLTVDSKTMAVGSSCVT